jgi:hypothetical protein
MGAGAVSVACAQARHQYRAALLLPTNLSLTSPLSLTGPLSAAAVDSTEHISETAVLAIVSGAAVADSAFRSGMPDFTILTGGGIRAHRMTKTAPAKSTRRIK